MDTRPEPNMGTPARKARAGIASAVVLVFLGACSSLGLGGSGDEAQAQATAASRCPRVAFVRDAAEVTRFREGVGRDLTDVTSRAVLADYTGGCTPRDDRVTVDLNLVLAAEQGPASRAGTADYRYFVAIADTAGDILAKQEFDTTVVFPEGQRRAGTVEELTQTIPLEEGATPADYQILVGFQLTPEQLDYNRARGGI